MRILKLLVCSIALFIAVSAGAEQLSIRVINAETGEPVRMARVLILEPTQLAETDMSGVAQFGDLETGTYRFVASRTGYTVSDTMRVTIPYYSEFEIMLSPLPWVIDEVVVTGTRSPHMLVDVPVQTEVIGQTEFRRTGARSVDQALAWSVGATVSDDLSGQGVALRGIAQDRILILVDGERAVGRVRGSIDLSQYSLTDVDRIEVVKGTGSTLYGSEAIGGVVNIITKRPEKEQPGASLYMDYGTHSTLTPSVDLNLLRGKFALGIGAKYHHTDGFDLDKSTPHTNGREEIDRLNLSTSLSAKLGKRYRLRWSGRLMNEDRRWVESELRGGQTFIYDDEETNHRYESSASIEYRSGERYLMNLSLYGTYYDHEWEKWRSSTGVNIDKSRTEDVLYEASYMSNYMLRQNQRLIYGFDWNYQDLDSSELIDDSEADKAWDGYVQYEFKPNGSVSLLPGVRFENHSAFGNHVNPSLNIMVVPHQRWKLRGYVGRGFRAPSIKEQYFVFDHRAAGYVVYGGSVPVPDDLGLGVGAFDPVTEENSINSSVSAELSYGAIGMHRFTYFYNHLEGLIDFVLVGFTPDYWRGVYVYQNIGTAITRGVEWESRVKIGKIMDFSLSYNYLDSKDLGTGEELINRPNHTIKLLLSGFHEGSSVGGSIWGEYVSDKLWVPRSNTGGNEGDPLRAPERKTLNMSLFKRFSNRIELFTRLHNIFDESKVEFGYWPGFEIFGGVKYDFSRGHEE